MTKIDQLVDELGAKTQLNEPLSKHTVLKVGGPARVFYQAESADELIRALKTTQKFSVPYLVLGMGANVLISDSGFDGLVVKNRTSRILLVGKKGKIKQGERVDEEVLIEAESGVTLVQLCRFSFDEGLQGLEFLYAIPGTVGGAIKINAHGRPGHNEFIGNLVKEVTLLTPEGVLKKVDQKCLDFAYDYSKLLKSAEIVISAVFRLKSSEKEQVWPEAMKFFEARKKAQPYDMPSAGCFFQNVPKSESVRLGLTGLIFSTGVLIAQTGLAGFQVGGAKISEKHSNFFVNSGEAKASDFVELIKLTKARVKEKFGVDLKEEIFLVGF